MLSNRSSFDLSPSPFSFSSRFPFPRFWRLFSRARRDPPCFLSRFHSEPLYLRTTRTRYPIASSDRPRKTSSVFSSSLRSHRRTRLAHPTDSRAETRPDSHPRVRRTTKSTVPPNRQSSAFPSPLPSRLLSRRFLPKKTSTDTSTRSTSNTPPGKANLAPTPPV